jgi:hypothetical protein
MCEWLLSVLDNCGRYVKLKQYQFIDRGPQSRNFGFNGFS